jgi:hypothetical protein
MHSNKDKNDNFNYKKTKTKIKNFCNIKSKKNLLNIKFEFFLMLLIILLLQNQNQINSKLIKVHVIPHSHDDAGWLATFDDYYTGRNSQKNCVECILNTMLNSLKENKERTFTYAEISFFEKWYINQTEENKLQIKEFVKEKRLEFLSGGWVMNDEANTYYQDIIDQIRLGMQFLKNEFDIIPRTAWYLDPFGHSLTNTYLMNKLGYQNLVIVRVDYRDKKNRIKEKNMEFYWKPYEEIDYGKSSIFTHITYDHYNLGEDWPQMFKYNQSEETIKYKLNSIYKNISNRGDAYNSDEIMLLYGDDFTFKTDAGFKNLELIIKLISNDNEFKNKMQFIYSTPEKYFNSIKINKGISSFSTYENKDFFPYSDEAKDYWTGYFTSRPYLKGLIRDAGNYLTQSSRFIFNYIMKYYMNLAFQNKEKIKKNLIKIENENEIKEKKEKEKENIISLNTETNFFDKFMLKYYKNFDVMRRELAIAQHHDAVTGTARNDVSDDYIYRLKKGIKSISDSIIDVISKENFIESNNSNENSKENLNEKIEVCLDSISELKCVDRIFNEEELEKGILISVLNPGNNDTYPKSLKIKVNKKSKKYLLINEIKKDENSLLTNSSSSSSSSSNFNLNSNNYIEYDLFYENEMGNHVIYFLIDFSDKISFKNFFLKLHDTSIKNPNQKIIDNKNFEDFEIKNEKISDYNSEKPYMVNIINGRNISFYVARGVLKVNQKVYENDSEIYSIEIAHGYYDYETNGNNRQGAYLMATNTDDPNLYKLKTKKSFISKGNIVIKINIKFEYSSLIIKIYPNLKEKDYTLDVQSILHKYEPEGQKEFMLIIKSNINNLNKNQKNNDKGNNNIDSTGETEFFTDTNGMRIIKRIKNFRDNFDLGIESEDDKISGNFYPINSVFYIKDNKIHNKNLYIFNDRPQAATSLKKGEILFDISRWGNRDDRKGLADGLYEYQSSRNHFSINHVIAFSKFFDYNNIYNFIHNKPLSVIYKDFVIKNKDSSNSKLNESQILAEEYLKRAEYDINILFNISDENCFTVNYYMINEKKFLFQFFNKSDPYLFTYKSCWIKLIRNEFIKIKVSYLNGVELKKNKIIGNSFLKKLFFGPLDKTSKNLLYEETKVNPQDFYTLIVEFK